MVDYSRLIGADEMSTLARLKALRYDHVDPKIEEYRGRIVKTTGDGLLAQFASVVDALRCAIEVQRSIAGLNGGILAEQRIALRMGISVGDIVVDGKAACHPLVGFCAISSFLHAHSKAIGSWCRQAGLCRRINRRDDAVLDGEVIGVWQRKDTQKLCAGDVPLKKGVKIQPTHRMNTLGKTSSDCIGHRHAGSQLAIAYMTCSMGEYGGISDCRSRERQ